MAANLKGRLSRLRSSGRVRDSGSQAPRARPDFLESWDEAGEFVWTRSLSYPNPLPPSVDPRPFAPLRRVLRHSGDASVSVSRIAAGSLRFFDLETSGLSGGTGTIAFLASVGKVDEDGIFTLSQVFLEDFPGEGAFVGIVLGLLGEDPVVVSYNGKAFDLPLLRTRCVMTGNPPPSCAQVDALFASRRLWRRVHGGASLGVIESEVLGIERGPDLPGAMIPEVWLSFAKGEASPLMPLVLSHNASDVVGLAKVVSHIASIFEAPEVYLDRLDIDRTGLGRSLIAVGRDEEGERLLEAASRSGDEAAALLLLRRYRRAGRLDEAVAAASRLSSGYGAALEKAKLYERGTVDLLEAARWAAEAESLAPTEAAREAASRRVARIARIARREDTA